MERVDGFGMESFAAQDRRKSEREPAGELDLRWSIVPHVHGVFGGQELHGEGRVVNLSKGGAAMLALALKRLQPGVRITIACDGGTGVATIRSVNLQPNSHLAVYGLQFVRQSRVLRERLDNHSPLLEGLSDFSDYIQAHHQLEAGL